MLIPKLIAAALALTLVSASLSAQVKGARNDSSERSARELDTVSVRAKRQREAEYTVRRITSATKTDLPLRDVPQSITVIPKALLADQSAQSMSEIARFMPGVTFGQGEGHRDAPTIRGNASTADFYVDGIRDDAEYFRDTYNTERVEAIKGSNAMVFGRGGGGGVINRVSKFADWNQIRSLVLESGSFDHKRTTLDIGEGLGPRAAGRLNAMAEKSGSFRDATTLTRRGLNPTATFLGGGNVLRLGYEYLADDRTVNRGVPSFQGRPAAAPIGTFFGDPDASRSWLYAHNGSLLIEREVPGVFTLRNRTVAWTYDKQYQNVIPGAVTADRSEVMLVGYRSRTDRSNLFNQTELVLKAGNSRIHHTMLAGVELGREKTQNFRETGYFGANSTTLRVPFASPTVASNIAFRQSATDPDNNVAASVASVYAQEQMEIGQLQAIAGIRAEQFTIDLRNNRNGQKLSRTDNMVSPRLGLTFKPREKMSLYGSLSVSHLPSSGDQFSSLSAATQTLKPEIFRNREIGFKWDILPALNFSSALYWLDRSNTQAPDPSSPSIVVQTGRQRSSGFETNLTGNITSRFQLFVGYANQRAEIVERTTASRAGATIPMVPGRSASFWSRYNVSDRFGAGFGIVAQSDMFAAIDNTVTLPGFARADGALYLTVARNFRLQANIENLFDTWYYANSYGNNSIMPGAPRTFRISVTAF